MELNQCARIEHHRKQIILTLEKGHKNDIFSTFFPGTWCRLTCCVMHQNAQASRLDIKKKLDNGIPTVPSTIKDELNCNIFLRAKNQEEFSKLRDLKDNF